MEQLMDVIRDYISDPDIEAQLWANKPQFNQVCSCLDMIGDTQYAIDAYFNSECGTTLGARYIALYGLFQAFILQQDAVFHLCEALGYPKQMNMYPDLETIRELRNRTTGHPTKKERPKAEHTSYHFVSRMSLTPESVDTPQSFKLMKCDGVTSDTHETILLQTLRQNQARSLADIIASLISDLTKTTR